MADFARWGVAVGRGLGWKPNAFLSAYETNRIEATEPALDSSPLGSFLLSLAGRSLDFEQSPTELLEVLTQHAEERGKSLAGWPKSARALTNELRRIAPQMRMHGVSIIMKRTNQGRRVRLVTGRYRACTEATADTDLAENPSI